MLRLENALERKKITYFLLWEDVGTFQGEFKIKKRLINGRCIASLISYECVSYVGA